MNWKIASRGETQPSDDEMRLFLHRNESLNTSKSARRKRRRFNRKLLLRISLLAPLALVVAKISILFADPKEQSKLVHWVDASVRNIWIQGEKSGAIPLFPAYKTDYYDDFPHFKLLEDNYEVIRKEATAILMNGNIPRLADMVPQKLSQSKVYTVDWKVYWLKMGLWIHPNSDRAPKTTTLIRRIPNVYNAFFSILEPNMHIDPHFGHYKGFLRYHLGLVVPDNNKDENIFLRIRPDVEKTKDLLLATREEMLAQGATYYWHEGEGVMFDDNPLHDATNCSNETRIVLFLDVARKMPWRYSFFNRVSLFFANRIDPIASMRKKAVVDETKELIAVDPQARYEYLYRNGSLCNHTMW